MEASRDERVSDNISADCFAVDMDWKQENGALEMVEDKVIGNCLWLEENSESNVEPNTSRNLGFNDIIFAS